jgi:intracellular septation protein
MILEYLPLLVFFISYRLADLYWAVGACMGATVLTSAYSYLKYRKITPTQAFSSATLLILGVLTLWLRDERFIKWKPTLVYWALALGFFCSHFMGKKYAMQHLLGNQLVLPLAQWRQLNMAWIGFFIVMGTLNLWIAFQYATTTWVTFKVFGGFGLSLLFIGLQALWLSRRPASG